MSDINLILFRKKDKWGFCDSQRHITIPAIYEAAEPFTEGLGFVECSTGNDFGYGFINAAGEAVVPIIYDDAQPFSEGLASVVVNRPHAKET